MPHFWNSYLLSKICYLKYVCTVILRGCAFLYDLLLIEGTEEISRKIPFLNFPYLSKAEHPENTTSISPSPRAFPLGRSVLSRSVDRLSCSKPPSAPRKLPASEEPVHDYPDEKA